MTAVPAEYEPTSWIEDKVAWFGQRAKARAARTGRPPGTGALAWWTAHLLGTTAAYAAFTIGAFLYALPIIAWSVLAVSILVLDAKVSTGRRKRRAAAAAAELPRVPHQEERKPVAYR
jgi:hypothetical protein